MRSSALTRPLTFLTVLSLPLMLGACGRTAEAGPLQVTFYYIPGCAYCARVMSGCSDLEAEMGGRVIMENLDATEPEARVAVAALGFHTHGLVVRSAGGKVLWKQGDHQVRLEDLRSALGELLPQLPPSEPSSSADPSSPADRSSPADASSPADTASPAVPPSSADGLSAG